MITAIESFLGKPAPRAAQPAPITEVDFLPTYLKAIERLRRSRPHREIRHEVLHRLHVRRGRHHPRRHLHPHRRRPRADPLQPRPALSPASIPSPSSPTSAPSAKPPSPTTARPASAPTATPTASAPSTSTANFVDPHKIYSVLLNWVLQYKGWPGAVTRAFNTTKMLDRIARKYGRELIEHGIGFKYVVDLMLEREIVMGGEESGGIGFQRHLPERDGLLNCLMLANVMAQEKKTLGQLVADLQAEYGEHQYGRIDLHLPDDAKERRHRPRPRPQARRPRLRRHGHLLAGKSRRRKVLPRQPRSHHQAQRPPKPGCCSAPAAPSRCCASTPNPAPRNPSPSSSTPRARSRSPASPRAQPEMCRRSPDRLSCGRSRPHLSSRQPTPAITTDLSS